MNKADKRRKSIAAGTEAWAAPARIFKALSHPARVRIAVRLLEGDCCVTEAGACLDLSQPNVSQHFKILKDAGLVAGRRQGVKICYRLADPRVARILRILYPEENER